MGGKGGAGTSGGGGGSGYTDDSVTVVSTQLGGSEFTTAKVILRIVTRTIQKVTFTQSRTTNENSGFDLTLQSGNGPQTITFGSKALVLVAHYLAQSPLILKKDQFILSRELIMLTLEV